MAEITAAAVRELRELTQLPMMDCKKALTETDGDLEAAQQLLREKGMKTMAARADRSTEEGRIAIHTSVDPGKGAIVELQCESAPVASHEEFVQLANDLAQTLADNPEINSPEALWQQTSPSKSDVTLQEQCDELQNRIREVFRLTRIQRIDGQCGGYVHHDAKSGVVLEIDGDNSSAAKDISMHVAAMRPQATNKEDLDPAVVEKERQFLVEQAKKEGKPENVIDKMVEGRLRKFYAERVLTEQAFVKDDKQTVGKYADQNGLKLRGFVLWQLGKA